MFVLYIMKMQFYFLKMIVCGLKPFFIFKISLKNVGIHRHTIFSFLWVFFFDQGLLCCKFDTLPNLFLFVRYSVLVGLPIQSDFSLCIFLLLLVYQCLSCFFVTFLFLSASLPELRTDLLVLVLPFDSLHVRYLLNISCLLVSKITVEMFDRVACGMSSSYLFV